MTDKKKPMKLNIAFPPNGTQKCIELEHDDQFRPFINKRMTQVVEGDSLGEDWKGYIFKITGGNDRQGFPMRQGILTNGRVRLLLDKNSKCYRPRRTGERRRKSIRGCIVDKDLSVLNLVVEKKGSNEIEGLTDTTKPNRLGPKRVGKIRKLYNLSSKDDVRKYVLYRPLPLKPNRPKPKTKAPKIQRLVTPNRLQRKRHLKAVKQQRIKKSRAQLADYKKLLAQRAKEMRIRKASITQKRRTSSLKP